MKLFFTLVTFIVYATTVSGHAAAQTGGSYDLSHNVIGGGGNRSIGGQFTVEGTTGQNLAGTLSGGSSYRLRGGFWASEALVPTAAAVSISGRIPTAEDNGIQGVSITLTNSSTGEVLTALSSTFGYYRFEEITVGQAYILTVRSKRFTFDPATRVINLLDELTDEDFIALPNQ